jgi:hypothetical protein
MIGLRHIIVVILSNTAVKTTQVWVMLDILRRGRVVMLLLHPTSPCHRLLLTFHRIWLFVVSLRGSLLLRFHCMSYLLLLTPCRLVSSSWTTGSGMGVWVSVKVSSTSDFVMGILWSAFMVSVRQVLLINIMVLLGEGLHLHLFD